MGVAACLNKPITAGRLLKEIQQLGDVRDVLVVDDDRAFCRLIERMLTADEQAYQVRQAYDGDEALLAMQERRPDLLLLDLIMPAVDGFQVRETMQRDEALATVPVILLTASGYAQDALTQRGSRIVINQPGGLKPVETLQCLEAIVRTLQPHYDDRETPATAGAKLA
jgi:CheY-like chemotaxis protein